MTMQLEELLARWDSNEGKPYKGALIDWGAYVGGGGKDGDPDLGCMCAQGQVLHVVGGWEPERLRNVAQVEADQETARLLNISTAHAILLRQINDTADAAGAAFYAKTAMASTSFRFSVSRIQRPFLRVLRTMARLVGDVSARPL